MAAMIVAGMAMATSLAAASPPPGHATASGLEMLRLGRPARVQPIQPGFLGLSLEYTAIEPYAGTDPSGVDPVFLQLVKNLNPSQSPVLRIGGDSSDWAWWPVTGMKKPGGVRITLTPGWMQVMSAVASQLQARLIMGLNLEAGSRRLAEAEANAFTTGLPTGSIAAFEPGNEPELYGSWTYYVSRSGQKVRGRAAGYSFTDFERNFESVHRLLPHAPLAGPSIGGKGWLLDVPHFLTAPGLQLVTVHGYPFQICYTSPSSPQYPTLAHFLSPTASRGLAARFRRYAALAHRHHLPLRIDEINSVSCGGSAPVARTFAAALWALDAYSALAYEGIDGVNIHTYPNASYQLFSFTKSSAGWSAHVEPEYYGLLMFAQADPPGSRPLEISGPAARALSAWATRGKDGHVRVVLINESRSPRQIGISASGVSGDASLTRLLAPGPAASQGITLGGQSFPDQTSTGTLPGTARVDQIAASHGAFTVQVPPISAALVELP